MNRFFCSALVPLTVKLDLVFLFFPSFKKTVPGNLKRKAPASAILELKETLALEEKSLQYSIFFNKFH